MAMRRSEGVGGVREGGEEVVDFGEVGERADVEAEVHELEGEEEGLDEGGGGGGQVLFGGKDAVEEVGRCGVGGGCGDWGGVRADAFYGD